MSEQLESGAHSFRTNHPEASQRLHNIPKPEKVRDAKEDEGVTLECVAKQIAGSTKPQHDSTEAVWVSGSAPSNSSKKK
jgi:hypothetical protein